MYANSRNLYTFSFINVKVLPGLTFIPAHFQNGKRIACRAKFEVLYEESISDVYMEMFYSKRVIKSHTHKVTAWDKLAYTCCLNLSEGRSIDLTCTPQSYTGPVFLENGDILKDSNNDPVMVTKLNFTAVNIILGRETQDQISGEIAAGIRPKFWDVAGSDDNNIWYSIVHKRCNIEPDLRRKWFGFAKMEKPKGHGIKF